MSHSLEAWQDALDTANLPAWLIKFDGEPRAFARAFLGERELLGTRDPADAVTVLDDWLQALSDAGGFASRLDSALAECLDDAWYRVAESSTAAFSLANAFDIASRAVELRKVGAFLRARAKDRTLLDAAPRRLDLTGAYLAAVARHQCSRELAPMWREVSGLQGGTPWHHGRHALRGVRGMPALSGEEGGFRREVAQTAVAVVEALTRKVVEGELDLEEAREEQRSLTRLAFSAYPSEEGWRAVVADRLAVSPAGEPTLRDVFGWLELPAEPFRSAVTRIPEPQGWDEEANALAQRLRMGDREAAKSGEQLLEQQRLYASLTGETHFVLMTLTNLATNFVKHGPEKAEAWAREALWWKPSDSSGWNALVSALRRTSPIRAVEVGWEAAARFPTVPLTWVQLGRALRAAALFRTGALVYEHAANRFGPSMWRGLADLYSDARRPVEALGLYGHIASENGLGEREWNVISRLARQVSSEERDAALTQIVLKAGQHPSSRIELPSFDESERRLPDRVPLPELPDAPDTMEALRASSPIPSIVEARVLRREGIARQIADPSSAELLSTAAELLGKARAMHKLTPALAAEIALLEARRGVTEPSAQETLATPYVRAYRQREDARGQRVDAERLPALRAPWKTLREEVSSAWPAALLGEARTCLAVRDGVAVANEAQRALAKLAKWSDENRGKDEQTFEAHWSGRLGDLFDPSWAAKAELSVVRMAEGAKRVELDGLEEDAAVPVSHGTAFDPSLARPPSS